MTRTLFAAGLVAAVACVSAHAQTVNLKAEIPFEFRLGNTLMPAGEYSIHHSGSVLTVRADGVNKVAMALAQTASRTRADGAGKLVFHRYGDAYFLSKVWAPESATGQELRPSKIEREYISRAGGLVETASISVAPK